jgi:hypothetical protein
MAGHMVGGTEEAIPLAEATAADMAAAPEEEMAVAVVVAVVAINNTVAGFLSQYSVSVVSRF